MSGKGPTKRSADRKPGEEGEVDGKQTAQQQDTIVANLRPLNPPYRPTFISYTVCFLRFLAVWAFVILTIPIIWVLTPVRLLHTPLRKLGVPNSKLPLDIIQKYWSRAVVKLAGVRVTVEGTENIPPDTCTVIISNHASGLDPWVILAYSPVAVKFIFKRELMIFFPFVFCLGYILGHIPINRRNLPSAIESFRKAAKQMARYSRSICVFPEGTRSPTGQLLPFKKGAFHLAKGCEVPITPVVVRGAHELMDKGSIFPRSGVVHVKFLKQIEVAPSDTVEELSAKVRAALLKEYEISEKKDS